MSSKKINDVFISYAKEDESLVQLICKRFADAGLKAWEYKTTSKLGVDLETEYKYEIGNSRFFLLIDSRFARKSEHVRSECAFVQELKKQNTEDVPSIVILIAQKKGEWQKKKVLLERQHYITSIFLSEPIDQCLKRLCLEMDSTLVIEPMSPSDEDFIDEFAKVKLNRSELSVKGEELRAIMDSYESYQTALKRNDDEYMRNELNFIYLKCKTKHLPFPSIYLSLAALYKKNNELKKAQEVLQVGVESFPTDPRFYAAIATSYFYLADYKRSIENYQNCIELINRSSNRKHKDKYKQILLSIINVSLVAGKSGEDVLKSLELNTETYNDPELYILSGQIYYHKGKVETALFFYEKAFCIMVKRPEKPLSNDYFYNLIFCISQCYLDLNQHNKNGEILLKGIDIYPNDSEIKWKYARHLLQTGKFHQGVDLMVREAGLNLGIIKYHVELAAILKHVNDRFGCQQRLDYCLQLAKEKNIVSDEDKYYIGWAYYLSGEFLLAKHYFDLKKENPLIRGWVYYSEL